MVWTLVFTVLLVTVPGYQANQRTQGSVKSINDEFIPFETDNRPLPDQQCPNEYVCLRQHRYHCSEATAPYCGKCYGSYRELETADGLKCIRKPDAEQPAASQKDLDPESIIDNLVKDYSVQKANAPSIDKSVVSDLDGREVDAAAGDPNAADPNAAKPEAVVTKTTTVKAEKGPTAAPQVAGKPDVKSSGSLADAYFVGITAGCSIAGLIGLIVAGVCWYKLQKSAKDASESEYPAYGVTGPKQQERVGSPGDRKLAQSVQMYHYQHQKQQMIALEKANGEMKHDASDEDSEEENEEGDYTVYECPGLAPTGEMEVKNPLFSEENGNSTEKKDDQDHPGSG